MFRRIKPIERREEVKFPADLRKLGYFINKQDQIRRIEEPSEGFKYYIHKVERVNERHREAIDECIRRVLDKRFAAEGLSKHYFPRGCDPKTDRCVPILISDDLDDTEKVLIIVGSTFDDLGVWSVREMEGPGINHGSMISTIQSAKEENFRFIILNCGQNVYSPEVGRAVRYTTWKAATKSSPHIDEVLNRVPGHENVQNHVRSILDEVKGRVLGKKRIYFLTYGWGCWGVVKYLNDHFSEWKSSLEALIAVEPTHTISDIVNPDLVHFLRTRSRGYIAHADPPGTFIPDKRFISQTFSTNQMHSECIIPHVWKSLMLPWFKRVEEDPEGCNPVMAVDWSAVEKLQEGWGDASLHTKADLDPNKWDFYDEDDEEEEEMSEGQKPWLRNLEQVVDLRDAEQAASITTGLQAVNLQENIRPGSGGESKSNGVGKAAPSA
ncbi:hypothetical protein H072_9604 [Dactylellina haptotyla CBS 200.50]|uniref:Arb2 domain-containing protein n=1 Tax=Dactylellina haptotyla (strain CBS 200.50) TaxID=1284197 RepID=S8A1M1_DACHA|nr:hypothetical protein H072_9604 [Dactylellina haptotyla CBS 200.50]